MIKTRQQLEHEITLNKCISEERKVSNQLYAIKLVEKIVFAFVGLVLVAVVGAMIALVVSK